MSGLWQRQADANLAAAEPLAVRMRPRTLDEFAGQRHFLGEGKLLRRMLEADRLTSVLFYGPPGTGKTTLAELIAKTTRRHFERGNAAAVGVKDVRHVLDAARTRLANDGPIRGRTIFFLDEIHRFNRAQQDVLLGDVERGVITLIGATTENPYFAVNSALVSRSQVFQFEPLTPQDVEAVVRAAIADPKRGFGELDITIDDDAVAHWATASDGDARRALTALEIAVLSSCGDWKSEIGNRPATGALPLSDELQSPNSHLRSPIHIDLATAQDSIQHKAVVYDGSGDQHYDTISAFIKSMRGSDPDAAVYWLAKMLVAGEDPLFIARRIAILASEDIGNADPRALTVAAAAYDITHRIGLPEARLTLAQAAIYMATAPKSNATTVAIGAATKDVRSGRTVAVPRHLRDGHYKGAKELGNAVGYQYAHNAQTGFVDQDYLGADAQYYIPSNRGYEQRITQFLEWIDQQRAQPRGAPDSAATT